jgi:hypothetical protein
VGRCTSAFATQGDAQGPVAVPSQEESRAPYVGQEWHDGAAAEDLRSIRAFVEIYLHDGEFSAFGSRFLLDHSVRSSIVAYRDDHDGFPPDAPSLT